MSTAHDVLVHLMTAHMKEHHAPQGKVKKVMHEWGQGKLHSGKGGPIVKNQRQAVAIAMNEQRKANKS